MEVANFLFKIGLTLQTELVVTYALGTSLVDAVNFLFKLGLAASTMDGARHGLCPEHLLGGTGDVYQQDRAFQAWSHHPRSSTTLWS